jgi:GT2 family glycosyltransferase
VGEHRIDLQATLYPRRRSVFGVPPRTRWGEPARTSDLRRVPADADSALTASAGDGDEFELALDPDLFGWAEVSITGRARPTSLVTLFVDRGEGFSTANTYRVGYLQGALTTVRRYVPLRNATRVRLRVSNAQTRLSIDRFECRSTALPRVAVHAISIMAKRRRYSSSQFVAFLISTLWRAGAGGLRRELARQLAYQDEQLLYQLWCERQLEASTVGTLDGADRQLQRRPTFSVLVPVVSADGSIPDAVTTLLNQSYREWELCLAIDRRLAKQGQDLTSMDPAARVKCEYGDFRGRFDLAFARALEMASGDFIALLSPSDAFASDALLQMAKALDREILDVVYSDEDTMEDDGRFVEPNFKPQWSPESALSENYVGRLSLYRTSVVRALRLATGEYSSEVEHDLLLRVSEATNAVGHVPRVLYHRRRRGPWSQREQRSLARAAQAALRRRALTGSVEPYRQYPGRMRVRIAPSWPASISIVVPTRDQPELLARCLDSVFARTTYSNFDVWVLDNGSTQLTTREVLRSRKQRYGNSLHVVDCEMEFNFARLANLGASLCGGELILLLNNDTVVVTRDWLQRMAGFALLPKIGAVGPKLLYPDGTIQHAGVVLVGGVAGHSHRGHAGNAAGYRGRLLGVSNYSAVTAACMLMRRTVFEDIGGFDETLAVAFNDVDFCLRALRRGYRHVYLGDVSLIHFESQTRGHEETHEQRRRFRNEFELMRARWSAVLDADPFYSPHLTHHAEDFAIDPSAFATAGSSRLDDEVLLAPRRSFDSSDRERLSGYRTS